MIDKFVKLWEKNKENLREKLSESHPDNYEEIFKLLIKHVLNPQDDLFLPSPEKIYVNHYGTYQGVSLFIVTNDQDYPDYFWVCKVFYGSCGGCDTYQHIRDYDSDDGIPTNQQVEDYMTLALHMIQETKEI